MRNIITSSCSSLGVLCASRDMLSCMLIQRGRVTPRHASCGRRRLLMLLSRVKPRRWSASSPDSKCRLCSLASIGHIQRRRFRQMQLANTGCLPLRGNLLEVNCFSWKCLYNRSLVDDDNKESHLVVGFSCSSVIGNCLNQFINYFVLAMFTS